jgi:formylglycine-generating enzyme required for sulfatase activity
MPEAAGGVLPCCVVDAADMPNQQAGRAALLASLEAGQSLQCEANQEGVGVQSLVAANLLAGLPLPGSGAAECTQAPWVLPADWAEKMVWIPAGEVQLGTHNWRSPDASRPYTAHLGGFWVAKHELTVAQFRAFVAATGYVTFAERTFAAADFPGMSPAQLREIEANWSPGGLVFTPPDHPVPLRDPESWRQWWSFVPGASWQHPQGPGSDAADHEPVTQVCALDALAYCHWASSHWGITVDLPTDAEWECAARGGLVDQDHTWGNEPFDPSHPQANLFTGDFPYRNTAADGFALTAPVGSFPANGYGLFDMCGNVWEITREAYPVAVRCNGVQNPTRAPDLAGAREIVTRGGSQLCQDSYCLGYKVHARMHSSVDSAQGHTGFRIVVRP